MAKFAKWIGGGFGWAIGGPIGAIIGFALGSAIDSLRFERPEDKYPGTTPGDFAATLLVLSAAIMKADGKIMKSELDYVKRFYTAQFGEQKTLHYLRLLKNILEQDFSLTDVCFQVKTNMDYHSRIQILHYLFGIAASDGEISRAEAEVIAQIANCSGISTDDFNSVKAMFVKDVNTAYNILGINPDASIPEIKKAYRNLAVKYHPDKLVHLGEEFQNAAKEKFQKVNEAYETIKKEKGFS